MATKSNTAFTHHESTMLRTEETRDKGKVSGRSYVAGTGGHTTATVEHTIPGVNDAPCFTCHVVHAQNIPCDYGDAHIPLHPMIAVLGDRVVPPGPGKVPHRRVPVVPLQFERHTVDPVAVAAAHARAEQIRRRQSQIRLRIKKAGIV